jgi:hypothetical protein
MLKRGQNPRKILEGHRERGPKKYFYTQEDLAEAFGMTRGALRVAMARGQVDPESLQSIVEYFVRRQGEQLIERHSESLRGLVEEARSLTGLEE